MAQPVRVLGRTTPGGIKYALMEGYPKFSVSKGQSSASEKWLIKSGDVNQCARELVPPAVITGGVYFQPQGVNLPLSVFVSDSVDFEPQSSDGLPGDPFLSDPNTDTQTNGTYDPYYYAMVNYVFNEQSAGDYDPSDPVTFLTHSIQSGGGIRSVPSHGVKLNGAAIRDKLPIAKIEPTLEHTLKWDNVVSPNWSFILNMLGKVNNAPLRMNKTLTAAAGTVLFTGVSGSQKYLWDGFSTVTDPWEMSFKFSQRYITDSNVQNGPAGWNHIYNTKSGQYQTIELPDGSALYTAGNLASLFT
jgi:hypothetical protein